MEMTLFMVQPDPEKMRLEILIEMQIEILDVQVSLQMRRFERDL